MIIALSIRNLLLIDRLDLEPGEGFTALTGETGAGKSIILDALALALGGPADRGLIRAGEDQASITVAFAVAPGHPVWAALEEAGLDATPDEVLTLKRVLKASGPARAWVNDQPVSAGLLARFGEDLVEIHGQHSASALLRPGMHQVLLDQFAGNEALLASCRTAWQRLAEAREAVTELAETDAHQSERRETLQGDLARLEELAPQPGEATRLGAQRTRLMQAERVSGQLSEAAVALADGEIADILGKAARAMDQITRLAGFEEGEAGAEARAAAGALERALIEVQEGERAIAALSAGITEDPDALESVETRLFTLRAAARKHSVEADLLPDLTARLQAELESLDSVGEQLARARAAEREALAAWHGAAEKLSAARKAAAGRLEKSVMGELKPLKLERTRFRAAISSLEEGKGGASGRDRVAFEVETNTGTGFGRLDKVASGGELARISLALKCALAGTGEAGVLIFDEADQGVGGAVAAAIGERFSRLGAARQVFAVTHSPQVAATADTQWAISKTAPKSGLGRTRVDGLDSDQRTEEIARMLAGADITPEARAAARRLLEDTCPAKPRPRL